MNFGTLFISTWLAVVLALAPSVSSQAQVAPGPGSVPPAPANAPPLAPAPAVPIAPAPRVAPETAPETPAASSLTVAPAPALAPAPQASSLSVAPLPPVTLPARGNLKLEDLTLRLLALEQHQIALEEQRKAIKTLGWRIAVIATWSAAGILAYGAAAAWARAEGVKSELDKADPDEDAFDTDGDNDVDKHDEAHSRQVARGFAIASAIPAAAGIVSTVFYRFRTRARSKLTRKIENLTPERRAILDQVRTELNLSGTQAGVDLHFRF